MKKILLIEDDYYTIELYKEIFKKGGFEFEVLQWGQEAIEYLKEIREGTREKPDLILLDLILPDINGIEVLKEIKKDEKIKDIIVYILTNYIEPQLTKELIRLGANKFLVKTEFNPQELLDLIKKI